MWQCKWHNLVANYGTKQCKWRHLMTKLWTNLGKSESANLAKDQGSIPTHQDQGKSLVFHLNFDLILQQANVFAWPVITTTYWWSSPCLPFVPLVLNSSVCPVIHNPSFTLSGMSWYNMMFQIIKDKKFSLRIVRNPKKNHSEILKQITGKSNKITGKYNWIFLENIPWEYH